MAVGKKETIHIDLTSVSEVGPMGVPGMSSKPGAKFGKSTKGGKKAPALKPFRDDAKKNGGPGGPGSFNNNLAINKPRPGGGIGGINAANDLKPLNPIHNLAKKP